MACWIWYDRWVFVSGGVVVEWVVGFWSVIGFVLWVCGCWVYGGCGMDGWVCVVGK